jgi:hypothetical protein
VKKSKLQATPVQKGAAGPKSKSTVLPIHHDVIIDKNIILTQLPSVNIIQQLSTKSEAANRESYIKQQFPYSSYSNLKAKTVLESFLQSAENALTVLYSTTDTTLQAEETNKNISLVPLASGWSSWPEGALQDYEAKSSHTTSKLANIVETGQNIILHPSVKNKRILARDFTTRKSRYVAGYDGDHASTTDEIESLTANCLTPIMLNSNSVIASMNRDYHPTTHYMSDTIFAETVPDNSESPNFPKQESAKNVPYERVCQQNTDSVE